MEAAALFRSLFVEADKCQVDTIILVPGRMSMLYSLLSDTTGRRIAGC